MSYSRQAAGAIFVTTMLVYASAYASGSSSDTRPTATATAETVTQVNTQSVVRVVSSAIQGSLARITGGVAGGPGRMRQPRAPNQTSELSAAETGISAGDAGAGNMAGWVTADYTFVRINPDGDKGQRRLTDVYSGVLGMDGSVSNKALIGVALAYGNANTDGRNTNFTRLDQGLDSYTLTPYFGYSITDNIAVDGLLGFTYARMTTDDYRNGRAASGDNTGRTYFGAINGAYYSTLTQQVGLKTFAGFSYVRTNIDDYQDSQGAVVVGDRSSHWLARLGTQMSVEVSSATSMYLGVAYEHEKAMPALSENSARFTLGATNQIAGNTSLTMEGTANVGRETQQEYSASANLRMSF